MIKSAKFQTKDFIIVGVLSAVFFGVFMLASMLTAMAGPIVHIFSPVLGGLLGGVIYLLMVSKSPKNWVFTISTVIVMILMQLVGGSYLPWLITTVLSAIIADLICMSSRYKNFKAITVGYSIMMVGQALGNVLPVVLFAEKFRKTFIERGVEPIFMDTMINFIKGPMAIVILAVSFLAATTGMIIGKKILNKHFKKAGVI